MPDALLHRLVDVLKMGPASANCSPARFIFVKSKEAKERLKLNLSEGSRISCAISVTAIGRVMPLSPRFTFAEMAKIA